MTAKTVPRTPGLRVLARLEGMGAPAAVVEDVRARLAPARAAVVRVLGLLADLPALLFAPLLALLFGPRGV